MRESDEHLALAEAAIGSERKPKDHALQRVGVIQHVVSGAERGPVADNVATVVFAAAARRVETIQAAGRGLLAIVHRARPDAARPIDGGVVHATVGHIVLRRADRLDAQRVEEQACEAALEARDEPRVVAPLHDPAEPLRHRPTHVRVVAQGEAVQRLAFDVHPVHGVLARHPERSFAEHGPRVAGTTNCFAGVSSCTASVVLAICHGSSRGSTDAAAAQF